MTGQTGGQGSVTMMLVSLNQGDLVAVQPLWEKYFDRLVRVACRRLSDRRRACFGSDEEDIALSAFASFCECAARGRFPDLRSREDLWRLLLVIVARKAASRKRWWGRREGKAGVLDEQAFCSVDSDEELQGLSRVIGDEPSDEFGGLVGEEFRRLVASLGNPTLQKVARMRMEGYTTGEIGQEVGVVRETVSRAIRTIKVVWVEKGLAPSQWLEPRTSTKESVDDPESAGPGDG